MFHMSRRVIFTTSLTRFGLLIRSPETTRGTKTCQEGRSGRALAASRHLTNGGVVAAISVDGVVSGRMGARDSAAPGNVLQLCAAMAAGIKRCIQCRCQQRVESAFMMTAPVKTPYITNKKSRFVSW